MSLSVYERYTVAAAAERRLLPPLSGVNFMTNDYLGLSQHPAVKAAAMAAIEADGCGNRAARLAGGNTERAEAVEAALATFKGTQAALLFSSGFQMNSTVLPTLLDAHVLGTEPLVLIDRLAHASLYQGLAAWGGRFYRFAHNDANHVEALLRRHHTGQPTWLITESVFSMDGDYAPLKAFINLKHHFNFMLYVDEAHSTGILGADGRGRCHGLANGAVDIIAGTLGKALGSFGGYIATSELLRRLLINRCPGFIYTTALPPSVLGAVAAALKLLPSLEAERCHLLFLSSYIKKKLQDSGFNTIIGRSPIVPILLGHNTAVLAWQAVLAEAGYAVAAIRPPTVPPGTARLRLSLTATHTQADVDGVLGVLTQHRYAA